MGFSGGNSPLPINNYIKLGLIPTIYMVRTIIIKSTRLDLALGLYFLNAHDVMAGYMS
jgi:hypothetical protein